MQCRDVEKDESEFLLDWKVCYQFNEFQLADDNVMRRVNEMQMRCKKTHADCDFNVN